MDVTSFSVVDRVEPANVDWQVVSDVDPGVVSTVEYCWGEDNESCHLGICRDLLAEVDRVAVMKWVVSALGLADATEGKEPAKIS